MLLSIIIPVYNVEAYIENCINSVLNQKLNTSEFEILVIDDESPDNSIEIVRKIAENNLNINIISQKNKGLGGARNTGIKNASGEYILFLDSDDYIINNRLKELLLSLKKKKYPDILEFGSVNVSEQGKELLRFTPNNVSQKINGITYYNTFTTLPSACNKLYNTDFLKENKLAFKEKMYIEDFEFNTRALFYSKRIASIPLIVSSFVQTNNSITRNNNTVIKERIINDIITIIKLVANFEKKNSNFSNEENKFFSERKALLTVNWVFQAIKYGFEYNRIKSIKKQLIKDNYYFVNSHIRNKKKNLFRLIIKYCFCSIRMKSIIL